jgi:hypothetical protein
MVERANNAASGPALPAVNWAVFFDAPQAHPFMTRARDMLVREGVEAEKARNLICLLVANIAHELQPQPKAKQQVASVEVDVYDKGDLLPRLLIAPGTPALELAEQVHCAIIDVLGVLRMFSELVRGEDEQSAVNCAHRTLAVAKGMAYSLEEALATASKTDEPRETLIGAIIAASCAEKEASDAQ